MALKSQRNGAAFEGIFERVCKSQGIMVTRMPLGCKRMGRGRLIPVKTPFDWVLSHLGKAAFIDTKTCQGHFPHSHIEAHQALELAHHAAHGITSGYVIWMRDKNAVVFVGGLDLVLRQSGSIQTGQPGVHMLGALATFDARQIFQL